MRAVIVDDEPLARLELRKLLLAHPQIDVIGEASNGTEALAKIREIAPDLVFLDIQMPGMTGFDVLRQLPDQKFEVIFVTAYDRFAMRAFEVNAVDYLLKPVDPTRLGDSLARAQDRLDRKEPEAPPQLPLAENDQVFIRDGDRCWFAPVREIRLLEACGNYTRIVMEGDAPLVHRPLAALEARLPEKLFLRANRSQIVNTRFIESAEVWFSGGLKVRISGGIDVEFSRRQSQTLRERMSL